MSDIATRVTSLDGELPCEVYTAPSGATIIVGRV